MYCINESRLPFKSSLVCNWGARGRITYPTEVILKAKIRESDIIINSIVDIQVNIQLLILSIDTTDITDITQGAYFIRDFLNPIQG